MFNGNGDILKRSDLALELSTEKKLLVKDSENVVNILISEITQALFLGRRVELRGFGVFSAKYRNKRIGRNPKSGVKIRIEKKQIPHFKIAKKFYEEIN